MILLFLLGMGTFLPFFLMLWLAAVDNNPIQTPIYEKPDPIEVPYINPALGPFAENVYTHPLTINEKL